MCNHTIVNSNLEMYIVTPWAVIKTFIIWYNDRKLLQNMWVTVSFNNGAQSPQIYETHRCKCGKLEVCYFCETQVCVLFISHYSFQITGRFEWNYKPTFICICYNSLFLKGCLKKIGNKHSAAENFVPILMYT